MGTGLGDSVDTTAYEVGLTNIIRSDDELDFLESVERNRGAAAGEVG